MYSLLLNHEWHRQPFSELERSLRIPKLIKYTLFGPLIKFLLLWYVFALVLYSSVAGFLFALLFEMFTLRYFYIKYILPKHLKNAQRAKSYDPNWTPFIHAALAVVTDIGGALSHAAIVCREYGIPAVVGTQEATLAIKDGQRVTVDGAAGIVTIE